MNSEIPPKAYWPISILLCFVLLFSIGFIFFRQPGAGPSTERVINIFESEKSMYFSGVLLFTNGQPTVDFEGLKWKPVSEFTLEELNGRNEIWYRIPLPVDEIENPTLLLIPRYVLGLEIYRNRECFFKYGSFTPTPPGRINFAKVSPRMVPLPGGPKEKDAAPPILYVRKQYNPFPLEAPMGEGYAGPLHDIAALMTRKIMGYQVWESGMSIVFLFLSVVAFGVFVFRWKSRDYMSLSFGFFLLCAGMHYATWWMNYLFGLSGIVSYHLNFMSSTLLPVGIMALTSQLFAPRFRRFLKGLWLFHIVFVFSFGIYFMLRAPLADFFTMVYNGLALFETCAVFFLLFKSSSQKYYPLLFCAFSVLFLVAVVDAFRWTIWLIIYETQPDEHFYGIGVLALIGAFGYIIVDHYKHTREKVRNYALELEVSKRNLLQLKSENLQARFDALKGQLNPHFLFNTFGTLIALIQKNQVDAVHFVEDLSRVYRHLLQTQDRELVTLQSELDFTVSYSYLVKKRFGEKVSISIEVDERYQRYFVPPLSLQLLIENAIKHNVISRKNPLKIGIDIHPDDYLVVQNNFKRKPVLEKPTQVGLLNLKQRYGFFTRRQVQVFCDNITFRVKIPLLSESESEADHCR